MNTPNPFSLPEPWSLVASGYAETTMHFLGQYTDSILARYPLAPHFRVADIACGPGTVSRKIYTQVARIDAVDFSQDMIALLQQFVSENQISTIHPVVGDGQALPLKDSTYDLAISMFGLMFFPDRIRGFSEAYRILDRGGRAIVASWAPVSDSPAMQLMFGAIRMINPNVPKPGAVVTNLESPDLFKWELGVTGFKDVEIFKVTQPMTAESAESFWDDMEKGSAPIAVMKSRNTPEEWAQKREIAITYIQGQISRFPTTLTSDAWIATGIK